MRDEIGCRPEADAWGTVVAWVATVKVVGWPFSLVVVMVVRNVVMSIACED